MTGLNVRCEEQASARTGRSWLRLTPRASRAPVRSANSRACSSPTDSEAFRAEANKKAHFVNNSAFPWLDWNTEHSHLQLEERHVEEAMNVFESESVAHGRLTAAHARTSSLETRSERTRQNMN